MCFRRSPPSPMSGQTTQITLLQQLIPPYEEYVRLTNPYTPQSFQLNNNFPTPPQKVKPIPSLDDPMFPFKINIKYTFVALLVDNLYAHTNWPTRQVRRPPVCHCGNPTSCECQYGHDNPMIYDNILVMPDPASEYYIYSIPIEFYVYLDNLFPTEDGTPMNTKADQQKEFTRKVQLYNEQLAADYDRSHFQVFVNSILSKIQNYFKNVSCVPHDYKLHYGYDPKTLKPREETDDHKNNRVSFMVESLLKVWEHDPSTATPAHQSPTVLLFFNQNNYYQNFNFINHNSFYPNNAYLARCHYCIGPKCFPTPWMCECACSTTRCVLLGSSTVKNNGLLGIENVFFNSKFLHAEHITTRLSKETCGINVSSQPVFRNHWPSSITHAQQVAEANFDVPLQYVKFESAKVEKMETRFERDFVMGSFNFYDMPALTHLTLASLPFSPIVRDLESRKNGFYNINTPKRCMLARFTVGPGQTDPVPNQFLPPTWVLPGEYFDSVAKTLEYDERLPIPADEKQIEFPLLCESSTHLVCQCPKLVSVELCINRVEHLSHSFNNLASLTRVKIRMNKNPVWVKSGVPNTPDVNVNGSFNGKSSVMVACFNNCPSLVEVECEDLFRGIVKMQSSWNDVGDSKTPIKNLRFPNVCHVDVCFNNAYVDVLGMRSLKTINGRSFTAGTSPRIFEMPTMKNPPPFGTSLHYVLVNPCSPPFINEILGGQKIQIDENTACEFIDLFQTCQHSLPDFFSYVVDWSKQFTGPNNLTGATLWHRPLQILNQRQCPEYEYEVETTNTKCNNAERRARRVANQFAQELADQFKNSSSSPSPALHPATAPSSKTASQTETQDNLPKAVHPPFKTSSNVPQEAGVRRSRDSTEDSKITGDTPANDSGEKKQKKLTTAKK